MEDIDIFLTITQWIVISFIGIVSFVYLLRASISKIFKITNDKRLNDITFYVITFIMLISSVLLLLSFLIYFSFTLFNSPINSDQIVNTDFFKTIVWALFIIIAIPTSVITSSIFVKILTKFNKEKLLNDFWLTVSIISVIIVGSLMFFGSAIALYNYTEMNLNEFAIGSFLFLIMIVIAMLIWLIYTIKNACSNEYPFQISTKPQLRD